MQYAWSSYKKSSWGYGLIYSLGTSPGRHYWSYVKGLHFWDPAATMVTSLDTLLIMNLKNEYTEARNWIEQHLTIDNAVIIY